MTDISKYRNVSLTHDTYNTLKKLSKVLLPGGTPLSISKTVEALTNEKAEKLNGKITVQKSVTANNNALDILGRKKEPEENLWIAVIAKAVDDAIYSSDYREAMISIGWIESECKDFKFVCHLANRDPNYVYRKLKKQLQQRKQHIRDFNDNIRTGVNKGMKIKNALLAAKYKLSSRLGRKHKGGYHSGKKWGRKWTHIVHPGTQTRFKNL